MIAKRRRADGRLVPPTRDYYLEYREQMARSVTKKDALRGATAMGHDFGVAAWRVEGRSMGHSLVKRCVRCGRGVTVEFPTSGQSFVSGDAREHACVATTARR